MKISDNDIRCSFCSIRIKTEEGEPYAIMQCCGVHADPKCKANHGELHVHTTRLSHPAETTTCYEAAKNLGWG